MTGWAVNHGKKIGFGECVGTILPALPESDYYWLINCKQPNNKQYDNKN